MLVKGKQIATGADGVGTNNLVNNAVTPGKADLATVWAFTARPTVNSDPSGSNDLVRKSYVDAVAAGITWKNSVRAATAAPGTLADDFANGDVIDTDVTLVTLDRILIKNQATASQNGIYIVQATGAPVRASDLDTGADAAGAAVFVEEGAANVDKGFICTNNTGSAVVGTDALVFSQFTGTGTDANAIHVNASGEISGITAKTTPVDADITVIEDSAASNAKKKLAMSDLRSYVVAAATAGAALADSGAAGSASTAAKADHAHPRDDVVQELITTQAITSDTALTDELASAPIANSELQLWLNGILQVQGATKDYTVSGTVITWLASTGTAVDMETTDVLVARYKTQGA
jgi:hypothetical protein